MSFFRRDDELPAVQPVRRSAAPSAPGADPPVTRIAAGTRITGEISGTTELLIEGEVDGRIRLDGRVVVGKTGGVLGEVHGRSVLVAGRVEGPVRGSERVEVGGTGRLEGDIAAPRVTIAEGAFFKGKVEMGGGPSGPAGPAGQSKGGK
jgi:cytoskeletal protein CcmA (bactofilin family)